tara:strand:- start:249 stop:758 length:510 start_codon:yes stop_codon:yes gene_type:complete
MSTLKVNALTNVAGNADIAGVGKILQVVQTIKTNEFSTTNDDVFNDITGISLAITPSSTSSKVLATACLVFNTTSNSNVIFKLLRGSTSLGDSTVTTDSPLALGISGGKYEASRGNPSTFQFLDSPSTTSATTYKVQEFHNSGTFRLNFLGGSSQFSGSSTLTLMEVAA